MSLYRSLYQGTDRPPSQSYCSGAVVSSVRELPYNVCEERAAKLIHPARHAKLMLSSDERRTQAGCGLICIRKKEATSRKNNNKNTNTHTASYHGRREDRRHSKAGRQAGTLNPAQPHRQSSSPRDLRPRAARVQ